MRASLRERTARNASTHVRIGLAAGDPAQLGLDRAARYRWGRGVLLFRAVFAGEVLLDVLRVVGVAAGHGQQVGHRGHLFGLLLEKPLHEALALEVAFFAGHPGESADPVSYTHLTLPTTPYV